jgi:ribose transport system permease protein
MTSLQAEAPKVKNSHHLLINRLLLNQRFALGLLIILLFVGFGLATPAFFNGQFIVFPLLRDTATFTVVGLAQLCALSIGHMNLAVGRMAAVSAMTAGFAYEKLHFSLVPGVIVGLVTGAAIGAFAGWLIVKSRVNSFVVTLSLDFALLGLVTLVYISFTDAAAFTTKPAGMDTIRNGSLGDYCLGNICGPSLVPLLTIPALVALLIVWWIFSKMKLGRELLATGANLRAAQLSGVRTERRIITAHMMSGLLAGLGGLMLAMTSGSFSAAIGSEFMLPSFLGPILGGTILSGGSVAVFGTMLGTMLTLLIRQGLTVRGIGLETLNIALGTILLLALSTERVRTAIATRRKKGDK